MVESAGDILDHMNWTEYRSDPPGRKYEKDPPMEKERRLLDQLAEYQGLRPEELSARSGIPIQEVLSLLVHMELKGWVAVEPGNRYQSIIAQP